MKADPISGRNAMSNIWLVIYMSSPSVSHAADIYRFSSEVAGTIMVQCIPVLRPFVRDVTTSLKSKPPSTKSSFAKPYEPSPLSRTWERSIQTNSTLPPMSFNQSSIDPFEFDFKKPIATSTAGIEMVTMSEKRDFDKEVEVDEWERGGVLMSIVEESDEEKGFKDRRF
jgi:hypothetical protein